MNKVENLRSAPAVFVYSYKKMREMRALISGFTGRFDTRLEIERIGPDLYAVNEDGDIPDKREY